MGYDLQVPGETLEEAGASLGRVAAELEHAEDNAGLVAEAVGHPGLAGALDDFAGNWDASRGEIVEAIGTLDDIATACADTFAQIEQKLVQALEDAHSQATQEFREAAS
jgi:hypothetical protein